MKITREYLDRLDKARETVEALSVCELTGKPIKDSKLYNRCKNCNPKMSLKCGEEVLKRINGLM